MPVLKHAETVLVGGLMLSYELSDTLWKWWCWVPTVMVCVLMLNQIQTWQPHFPGYSGGAVQCTVMGIMAL